MMTPKWRAAALDLALRCLREVAESDGDQHFDDHLIEFRNDGWTVQHPIAERIYGVLFDCDFAHWDGGDIGCRGRYVLYADNDGQLCVGNKVTPTTISPPPAA